MSTDCDECGEHVIGCTCTDYEKDRNRKKEISFVDMMDKLDQIKALVRCAGYVVDSQEFKLDNTNSYTDLIMVIQDKIKEVQEEIHTYVSIS